MSDVNCYDVKLLLKELNLPEEEKEKIISELKKEFPYDEMMLELHLFRIVQHYKNRKIIEI